MFRIVTTFIILVIINVFQIQHALATEWGIQPIQKKSGNFSIKNSIEALNIAKDSNAPIYVGLHGWSALEPEKDNYKVDDLLNGQDYGAKQMGLIPFIGINTINTTKRDLPEYLGNIDWTDPELVIRFEKLLDKIQEKFPDGIPVLTIGNEVDIYFNDHPDEVDPYLIFYKKASAAAQLRFPNAILGITVTYEGLAKGRADIIKKMITASDMASFTYYPLLNLKPEPLKDIPQHLDMIVRAAQNKDIYLQEIGFPSSEILGSSETMQADFYSRVIPEIESRPQIKAASIFIMHDLDPKICKGMVSSFGVDDAGAENVKKFSSFLCSLGVRRLNGTTKPAWNIISNQLMNR